MGVVYDLNNSQYYSIFKNITFYFSTPFYKSKFDTKIEAFIKEEKIKLMAKYKTFIHVEGLDEFFAISLYQRIEKRGCRYTKNNNDE